MFSTTQAQHVTVNMYCYIVAVHGLSCDYLKGKAGGSNENKDGTWNE